jgi:hypothetical protein
MGDWVDLIVFVLVLAVLAYGMTHGWAIGI